LGAAGKSLKLLGELCVAAAVACWFQYAAIEMSWAGRRPLIADLATGQIISFDNHGLMYVSQSDLDFLHFFVAPGLLFGVIGAVLIVLHKVSYRGDAKAVPTKFVRVAGTIAQCAFILFVPIWLFANPYTALAEAFDVPEHLLCADIASAALMVGWWRLAENGAIFEGARRYQRSLR
jgi:hypothetical protein